MMYLHSRKPPIVHRDVKSDNFLITADWNLKVTLSPPPPPPLPLFNANSAASATAAAAAAASVQCQQVCDFGLARVRAAASHVQTVRWWDAGRRKSRDVYCWRRCTAEQARQHGWLLR